MSTLPKALKPAPVSIVVWSDLHAHMWTNVANADRWKDFVKAVRQVYIYAKDVNADIVVFNGDLFESKTAHSSVVWSNVLREIHKGIDMCSPVTRHLFNTGNHDLHKGHSVLTGIDGVYVAVNEPLYLPLDYAAGTELALIPFGCTMPPNAEVMAGDRTVRVAFTHCDIKGLNMGGGMKCDTTDLHIDWFKRVNTIINGHIHVQQHRKYRNNAGDLYCVGPPIPVSWSDEADTTQSNRGLMHLRVYPGDIGVHRHAFDWAPRFLGNPDDARAQDFLRVELEESMDADAQASDLDTQERRQRCTLRGVQMLEDYVATVNKTMDAGKLLRHGVQWLVGHEPVGEQSHERTAMDV